MGDTMKLFQIMESKISECSGRDMGEVLKTTFLHAAEQIDPRR